MKYMFFFLEFSKTFIIFSINSNSMVDFHNMKGFSVMLQTWIGLFIIIIYMIIVIRVVFYMWINILWLSQTIIIIIRCIYNIYFCFNIIFYFWLSYVTTYIKLRLLLLHDRLLELPECPTRLPISKSCHPPPPSRQPTKAGAQVAAYPEAEEAAEAESSDASSCPSPAAAEESDVPPFPRQWRRRAGDLWPRFSFIDRVIGVVRTVFLVVVVGYVTQRTRLGVNVRLDFLRVIVWLRVLSVRFW